MSHISVNQENKKIVLKEKDRITLLEMSDIIKLVCDSYITTVFCKQNSPISVSKLLKEFEEELSDYGFLRVNNNTIVNIRYIKTIITTPQRELTLTNNEKVKISRRKICYFKEMGSVIC
jgi:two-component system LytT family response regulator